MDKISLIVATIIFFGCADLTDYSNEDIGVDATLDISKQYFPPPECFKDEECEFFKHCSPNNKCEVDCLGISDCTPGFVCTDRGRCKYDPNCPNVAVSFNVKVPNIMLLIDRSGSMNNYFGQVNGISLNRWEAIRYALFDKKVGVVVKTESQIRFAASFYTDKQFTENTCPFIIDSPAPRINASSNLDLMFLDNIPHHGTPTARAIQHVTEIMKNWGYPKILILATDGLPSMCKEDLNKIVSPLKIFSAPTDTAEDAIEDAYNNGIVSYILNVGVDVAKAHMGRMANLGVGNFPEPPHARYHVATSPEELIQSLEEIISESRSCVLGLDARVHKARAKEGLVILNGKALVYNKDWVLKDEQTLALLNESCTTLLEEKTVQFSAKFPCQIILK